MGNDFKDTNIMWALLLYTVPMFTVYLMYVCFR